MQMIEYLQAYLKTDNELIVFILALILIASTTDCLFGWINAKFNKNVEFQSGMALWGIIKKAMYFIVLVFFMLVSVIVPKNIGTTSLIVLYTAFLISEINSILSHLEITDDGKKGEMLRSFIARIFENKEEK